MAKKATVKKIKEETMAATLASAAIVLYREESWGLSPKVPMSKEPADHKCLFDNHLLSTLDINSVRGLLVDATSRQVVHWNFFLILDIRDASG